MSEPILIKGETFRDERGVLSFINSFDLAPVRRFYSIFHEETSIIRAWQGHKTEQKWFFVADGSFLILTVKPDNWLNPSPRLHVRKFTLSGLIHEVLHVPGGYATGIKALERSSRLFVFSDFSPEDSGSDDYRFKKDMWFDWAGV